MYRRLKLARVAVSIFCIIVLTATIVGLLPSSVGKILMDLQFMHLVLAGAAGWIVLWLSVTLLAGRIYCSTVCPLGTLTDIFARILRRKRPYIYTSPCNTLRYSVLALVTVCIAIPVSIVPALLDPDSAYAIVCWELLRPVVAWVKDMLGVPPVYVASVATLGLVAACLIFLVAALLARAGGRTYCNTLCPAGAVLSLVSKNAILHFDIDTDACTHCGLCADVCKARCIDHAGGTVDMTRCVVCFNCTDACSDNAIRYTTSRHRLSTPLTTRIKGLSADTMTDKITTSNNIPTSDETISRASATYNGPRN